LFEGRRATESRYSREVLLGPVRGNRFRGGGKVPLMSRSGTASRWRRRGTSMYLGCSGPIKESRVDVVKARVGIGVT
jgi:hypothetical protein